MKICCAGDKSFVLEDNKVQQDYAGQVHYDNGIVDRIIAVGMKAAPDGDYVLEDKSD